MRLLLISVSVSLMIASSLVLASTQEEMDGDLEVVQSQHRILQQALMNADALPPNPANVDRKPAVLGPPVYESETIEASDDGAAYIDRIHLRSSGAVSLPDEE